MVVWCLQRNWTCVLQCFYGVLTLYTHSFFCLTGMNITAGEPKSLYLRWACGCGCPRLTNRPIGPVGSYFTIHTIYPLQFQSIVKGKYLLKAKKKKKKFGHHHWSIVSFVCVMSLTNILVGPNKPRGKSWLEHRTDSAVEESTSAEQRDRTKRTIK